MKGFSLFEILVVMGLFAILAIVSTQTLFLAFRGAGKSDAISRARENLSYAASVMQRSLRSGTDVSCAIDGSSVSFIDSSGLPLAYFCTGIGGGDGFVTSVGIDVLRLTPDVINITECSFVCSSAGTPPSVTIDLTAQDTTKTGIESAQITSHSRVNLRNY